jgi:hypothetical protein
VPPVASFRQGVEGGQVGALRGVIGGEQGTEGVMMVAGLFMHGGAGMGGGPVSGKSGCQVEEEEEQGVQPRPMGGAPAVARAGDAVTARI